MLAFGRPLARFAVFGSRIHLLFVFFSSGPALSLSFRSCLCNCGRLLQISPRSASFRMGSTAPTPSTPREPFMQRRGTRLSRNTSGTFLSVGEEISGFERSLSVLERHRTRALPFDLYRNVQIGNGLWKHIRKTFGINRERNCKYRERNCKSHPSRWGCRQFATRSWCTKFSRAGSRASTADPTYI